MSQIKILFFATLKDLAGTRQVEVDLPEASRIADLKAILVNRFPGLKVGLATTLVSINQEFSADEDPIPPQAEVAFFPPVSGGSGGPTLCALTSDPIDLNAWTAAVTRTTCGAVCLFTGVVRGQTVRGVDPVTQYLEYEAYTSMAEAKMQQVAGEIRSRWPAVEGIAIVQRIGELLPGTPSTLIACSTAHRDMGVFEAARYGIDRLKEIVPIWKKEIGPGGKAWVEGQYLPTRDGDQHAA
jgi:MoaE-MoaD fusion protein